LRAGSQSEKSTLTRKKANLPTEENEWEKEGHQGNLGLNSKNAKCGKEFATLSYKAPQGKTSGGINGTKTQPQFAVWNGT